MKYPIAIRSLSCPENAMQIVPKVRSVLWNLGKRCNYDCSYCSSHVHDSVSPFVDLSMAKDLVQRTHDATIATDQKIKWSFTGGEPFVDPGFMHLLAHIKSMSTTHSISVTTNGSVPLQTYLKAAEYLSTITISLHLERPQKEIDAVVQRVIDVKQKTNLFQAVNLMFLPGKLDLVRSIMEKFDAAGVRYTLRKIWNLGNDTVSTVPKKSQVLDDVQLQVTKKQSQREKIDIKTDNWLSYPQEELDFIHQHLTTPSFVNLGVWDEDDVYHEINSDFLLSNEMINFQKWVCYAGVDTAFVDFDGSVYRGMCMNDGPIGHISNVSLFVDTVTICQRNRCFCNLDMTARKSRGDRTDLIS